jgi:hypothetical protein
MSLSRTVLILESPDQIEAARARLGPLDRFRILATAPSVMHALDQRGIPYRIPEDYGSHEEVNRGLRDNFVRLRGWCLEVDRLFRARSSVVLDRDLRPANYHYQQIIRVLNPVWIKVYHLLRLIESDGPQEIAFFTAGAENLRDSYHFSDDDWLYAGLLPLVAKARGVALRPVDFPRPSRGGNSERRLRTAFLAARGRVRRLARLAISTMTAGRDSSLRDSTQRTIWVLHQGYDAGLLIEEFKHSRWRILLWPITNDVDDPSLHKPFWLSDPVGLHLDLPDHRLGWSRWAAECRQTWDAICEEPAVRSLFSLDGVDTFPMLALKVGRCFTDSLATVLRYHAGAEALFARHKPDAILSPWTTLPALIGVFDLARRARVPTFVYQHGGSRGYTAEKANFEDHSEGDYFLTYGEGVSQYVETTPPPGQARSARPLTVGSAAIDAMRARARLSPAVPSGDGGPPRPPRVLCVSWGYFVNSRYSPSYPATCYFLLERQKLELLGEFQNVEVLVKPYPRSQGAEIIRKIVAEKGWRHIKVVEDGQFSDWLSYADLLVLDYQGTPLVEAVATAKPLILYLDERFQRLTPEAEKALGKRAMIVRTPEEFLAVLRERLASGDFGQLSDPDDEFLRLYGTHLNDGNSLPRAYQAIVTAVNEWVPSATRAGS